MGVAEVTAGKAPPPQQKTFLFGVIAEYSFHSDDPEDLLFQKGDLLDILDQSDNNWWVARNAKGQTGLIPAPYVKVLEDAKPVYVSDEDNSRGIHQHTCMLHSRKIAETKPPLMSCVNQKVQMLHELHCLRPE